MFLNPASSSIFNENTTSSSTSFHRSSSKNENAAPLGMKTPHNNNNAKNSSSNNVKKSGQTTQRRRRALGDISNKGGSAAKASGKNGSGLALKPLSTNNQGLRSNNSSKNRQVKFSKSGSGIKSGKSSSLSSSSKPQQKKQSSSEYDGIFGVTTRWSNTSLDHDRPSPFVQLPKDEFELSNNVAEEIRQHRLKERVRKEEAEEKRMEERLRMKNDVLFDCSAKNGVEDDLQQLLTDHCNIVEDDEEQDALWELKTSPAWEEEDDVEFDPTKERRLSGTDPVSLWGDILSP